MIILLAASLTSFNNKQTRTTTTTKKNHKKQKRNMILVLCIHSITENNVLNQHGKDAQMANVIAQLIKKLGIATSGE